MLSSRSRLLRTRLGSPLPHLYIHINDGHSGRGDSGNPGGLAERARTDARELLNDLARESGHAVVLEPFRNAAAFCFLHALHLLLLLREVAAIFDIGLGDAQFGAAGLWAVASVPGFQHHRLP